MPKRHHAILPIAAFSDNYIWLIRCGARAAVIDPGQAEPVMQFLQEQNLTLTAILLTHHHNDHVGGVQALVDAYGCQVWGPAHETLPVCDTRVKEGDRVTLPELGLDLTVLDVPGHTAGHVAYAGQVGIDRTDSDRSANDAAVPDYSDDDTPVLFCGDTLFAAGCGRLFEGTPAQMADSFEKILSLPPETRVFCGHEYTLANMRWALTVESDNDALHETYRRAQKLRSEGRPTLPSTLAQERATNPFARTQHPAVAAAAARWAERPLPTPVDVFAALRDWKNNFK